MATRRARRTAKQSRKVSSSTSGWHTLVTCLGLVALTWVVFGRCLTYPFINYDDPNYILERPQITAGVTTKGILWSLTHAHGGNWHPLTSFSHMVDCQIFGLSPAGPHAVNIALHSLTAALLFVFLRRATGSRWRSSIVAALFAIHPLRVESVAWIAERKDVLSGVFFMLTLNAYLTYVRGRTSRRYLLTLVLFALGLMAKPMLVTTPLVFLILDWWLLHSELDSNDGQQLSLPWKRLLAEKTPFVLLAAASSVATLVAQKEAMTSVEVMPLAERFSNATVSYVSYLIDMAWPAKLALFYPLEEHHIPLTRVGLSAVALLTISVAAFRLRRRSPALFAGWLWYLVMLVPVIGVIQVGLQSHADRYTYLPLIGINIAIVWLIGGLTRPWPRGGSMGIVAAMLAMVVLACVTRTQLSYWQDSEALWTRTLGVTASNDTAHAYLADLLLRQDRFTESIEHSEEALRIRPANSDAHNNLALALFRTGRLEEAVPHWQRSLELDPKNRNARANYAWILATSTDPALLDGPRAVSLMSEVIADVGRDNPMVLRGLGAAYAQSGQFAQAITIAQEAMELAKEQQNSPLIADLRLNIRNYQNHVPLRDAGVSPAR